MIEAVSELDDGNPLNAVALAEYTALRSEIERRCTIQWNVVALQISSAGTIAVATTVSRRRPRRCSSESRRSPSVAFAEARRWASSLPRSWRL